MVSAIIEALTPAEDHPKAAPGELNHIRRFVNTHDLEDGSDDIAEPDALRDWLAERALIDPAAELTHADVREAQDVREALRKLLLANNGDPLDRTAVQRLNAAARRAEVQVHLRLGGPAGPPPGRSANDRAIGKNGRAHPRTTAT